MILNLGGLFAVSGVVTLGRPSGTTRPGPWSLRQLHCCDSGPSGGALWRDWLTPPTQIEDNEFGWGGGVGGMVGGRMGRWVHT